MSNKIQPDDDPTEMEGSQPKDICYHLLKLYSERSHRLERTLCPNTHTSNPLDYALWLVVGFHKDDFKSYSFLVLRTLNQPLKLRFEQMM